MHVRKLLVFILAVVFFASLPAVAGADVEWSQPPKLDDPSTAYTSMTDIDWYTSADDFVGESELPVNQVKWWGGYWSPDPMPPPTPDFNITFTTDAPCGCKPHPYEQWQYPNLSVSQEFYGVDYVGYNIYEYQVDLPELFYQELGTKYWLIIQAVMDYPPYWGWQVSTVDPECSALQVATANLPMWCSGVNLEYGLAFEVNTVPIPGAVYLLGSGLLGLIGLRRKLKGGS